MLAQQKMEQLRGLTWGFDVLGLPTTDTTTNLTVVPEAPAGGKGLSPSPEHSLGTNTEGYCDFVDKFGKPLGGGTTAPAGTAYIRRWSVEPLPTNPNNTIVLQVLVTPLPGRNGVDTSSDRRARARRGAPRERQDTEGVVSVHARGRFSLLEAVIATGAHAPHHGEHLHHDAPGAGGVRGRA